VKQKIYLGHNVCLNSSYDFNLIKNALGSSNYIIVNKFEDADIFIYAGCGVRGVWIDNAINEINQVLIKNRKLKVVITGCFAAIEPEKIKDNIKTNNYQIMSYDDIAKTFMHSNIQEIDKINVSTDNIDFEGSNKIRKRIDEAKLSILSKLNNIDEQYNLNVSKLYRDTTKGFVFYNEDKAVETITVTRGCPYQCSYCSIPIGRGGEYSSVPLGDIIYKRDLALKNNISYINLLGDEIGNYGLGTKEMNLSKLLDRFLQNNTLKVSIRYIEPNPFLKHYEIIKKYCKTGRIKLLYLPIQSGSNKILKSMNRTYKINDDLINKILYLKENTNVIFYTNWMVGFNCESDEDFKQTISLVKKLNLHINMVIPFSKRPNTKAFTMNENIPIEIKKKRHTILFDIIKKLKRDRFEKELFPVSKNGRNKILDKIVEAENYFVQFD